MKRNLPDSMDEGLSAGVESDPIGEKVAGLQLCVSELERRIADMQKE